MLSVPFSVAVGLVGSGVKPLIPSSRFRSHGLLPGSKADSAIIGAMAIQWRVCFLAVAAILLACTRAEGPRLTPTGPISYSFNSAKALR